MSNKLNTDDVEGRNGNDLMARILMVLLIALGLQVCNVRFFGFWRELEHSWLGSLGILILALVAIGSIAKVANREEKIEILSAWKWWGPWAILLLLILQVNMYPTAMHDSLSYRLPRIFLWLQEGEVKRVVAADDRINVMPWGWEANAIPFASLNLIGFSRLLNIASLLVVYQVLHQFALGYSREIKLSRYVALGFACAPGLLLQAASTANDLYTAALLLIAIYFIIFYRGSRDKLFVPFSLLAFVLATNSKPQFMVLGVFWILWWAMGKGEPWKHIPYWLLGVLVPLYVVVSPLPVLYDNFRLSGSLMGIENTTKGMGLTAHMFMAVAGIIQFMVSNMQLPVMPGAEGISALIKGFPGLSEISKVLPQFSPELTQVAIVDKASFGLFHTVVIIVGVWMGWQREKGIIKYIVFASVIGFIIAASQVVPITIGRSFMGFGILLLPLAVVGWTRFFPRQALWIGFVGIMTGVLALVMKPSAPLWPSGYFEKQAELRGWGEMQDKLSSYNHYQDRVKAGQGILDNVPKGENVGVLLRTFTPLVNLWMPDWRKHRISFVHNASVRDVNESDYNWLLIGDNAAEQFPEQFKKLTMISGWEEVESKNFRPTLKQGIETWRLYRRIP